MQNPNTTQTASAQPENAPTPIIASGWKYTDLNAGQILSLRYSRAVAYKSGQYKMQPPPVCTTRWDDEAWQNWVQFDNENLTGFLPYTRTQPQKIDRNHNNHENKTDRIQA